MNKEDLLMVFTELAIILGSTGATLYGSAKLFGNYGGDTRTEEEKRNDFLRHTRESIDKNYYEKSPKEIAKKKECLKEKEKLEIKEHLNDVPSYYSHYKSMNEQGADYRPCNNK